MDLKSIGECVIMLAAAAEAGDESAKAALDKLSSGLGDSAQAALDAADVAPESVDAGSDEPVMSEDEKAVMASMSEDMKATYVAGKRAMSVKAEADKEVAAEADKKDDAVVAESDKSDKVAASFDLNTLNLIAAGEEAKAQSSRQRIVAEAQTKGLVSKSMAAILLDPSKTSEKVVADFIAGRKTKSVTMGGPAPARIAAAAPKTKTEQYPGVTREDRIAAEALSKKTGTPVEKLLANMIDKG